MKKLNKSYAGVALAALVAFVGLSPSAMAQLNLVYETGPLTGQAYSGGAFTIKYNNFDMGTVYNVAPGSSHGTEDTTTGTAALNNTVLVPQTGATGSIGAEDSWGVARVTSIEDGFGQTIWSQAGKNQEVTIMFYGAQDFNLVQNGLSQEISSYGLRIDMYLQNIGAPGYTAYDPTQGSSGRTGVSSYNTVTDGTLLLSTVSTPGFLYAAGDHGGTATEFSSEFRPGIGGLGSTYLNVIGGSMATNFNSNSVTSVFDPTLRADLFAQFTTDVYTQQGATDNWLVSSDDPVKGRFLAVPEPSTYGLMAAGALVGIVALRRRFQKRA